MKRILVTGGAGFLGSNLCKRLIKEGNHVICVDNLYTGRMVNIEELMDNPEFEFINHNIIEPLDIDNLDEIYNLACPASPPHYQKSPTYTTKTCVLGILNMLELATKNNAKIMQFSTSEVYGDPFVHPQVETYRGNVNPIGIRSCYDEGKRVAETLCFDYNREFGTRIKVIRIFNTYGPMMDPKDGRVVSNFIIQALKGEDITIYGDGSQTRSFCYVDDLIEGIVRMMASREDFLGPVNLGNPGEFTIRELAEIVLEMVDTKSKLVCMDLPKDDPTQRKPDITVAGRELIKSFSMDGLVYYPTLEEYKVCPAIMVQAKPGDAVIVSGDIGRHGCTILLAREDFGIDADVTSDCAPLWGTVQDILSVTKDVHVIRDATRGGVGTVLYEIAEQSKTGIRLNAEAIPVQDSVKGVCGMLGLEPLYLACEGRLVIFAPKENAEAIVAKLREGKYSSEAAIIGEVTEEMPGRVVVTTEIGAETLLPPPGGELLPRIC